MLGGSAISGMSVIRGWQTPVNGYYAMSAEDGTRRFYSPSLCCFDEKVIQIQNW